MESDDWCVRTPELIGRFCFFREPPGLRAIVRVVEARMSKDGSRVETKLVCVASHEARKGLVIPVGKIFDVSAGTGGMWNQVWLIEPLDAADVGGAVNEVQEMLPHVQWNRDAPSEPR